MELKEKVLSNDEIEKYLSEYLFLVDLAEDEYDYECLGDDLQFLFFMKSIYFHSENFNTHFGNIGIKFNTFMIRLLEKKPERRLLPPLNLVLKPQIYCKSLVIAWLIYYLSPVH